MSVPFLVAIDDGYAQTKVLAWDEHTNTPRKKMIRSSVVAGKVGLGSLSGDAIHAFYVTPEGPFSVSDSIQGESTKFDNFHTSPMNKVLVNHALIAAGYGGLDVTVCAGLPVSKFFRDGVKNEAYIKQKQDNLSGPIECGTNHKLAHIVNVDIGCQAVAAWVDYMLNDDLEYQQVPAGAVTIVDIGGRTTDIATVVNGEDIDHRRTRTQDVGVLDVYNSVIKGIGNKFATNCDLPLADVDEAVRTRKLIIWGEEKDISDIVDEAIKEQQYKIVRFVNEVIGDAASIRKVIFVGGGSALFNEISASFRHGHIPDDPEFANVRGLFKFFRYRQKIMAETQEQQADVA
ncbi:plasmid segregation protein ParM domain-containing protein [Pseudovibrio ascidiaceicola]|uniref:plasmid segregation protein ParM domain-containing protein n=1 Tax=Pseudovibrio ascidiaceicola TaxID=285279 RepID=UPI003D360969